MTKNDLQTTVGASCLYLLRNGARAFVALSTKSVVGRALCSVVFDDGPMIQVQAPVEQYDDALLCPADHSLDIIAYASMVDPAAIVTMLISSPELPPDFRWTWKRPPVIYTVDQLNDAVHSYIDAVAFPGFVVYTDGRIVYDDPELAS